MVSRTYVYTVCSIEKRVQAISGRHSSYRLSSNFATKCYYPRSIGAAAVELHVASCSTECPTERDVIMQVAYSTVNAMKSEYSRLIRLLNVCLAMLISRKHACSLISTCMVVHAEL